jgi:hypothetical protein
MVHRIGDPRKKIAMSYRIYIKYPETFTKVFPFAKGWFPMLEQRKYLEDAENALWMMEKDPSFKKIGITAKIVKEPAEPLEMSERHFLEKLGMKKRSVARGALESLFYYWG